VVFKAMLNPSEFSHKRAISYNTRKTLGQIGADTRFAAVNPDTVGFSLLLDGTGVVPKIPSEKRLSVEAQVKKLNDVVYQYVGPRHEPGHVRLLWGTLILYGRLTDMNISYTLFKPSGDPLRAKVTLNFNGFMSNKEAEAAAGRSSADLSHMVEVRGGDTLPLLCNKIYGDPAYYAQVARFNGLREFHRLKPGVRLRFPPLA
jgi:nucleoid-associated protein YgaU